MKLRILLVMKRIALTLSFAVLLPGCPLTDEYYVEPEAGQTAPVVARCGDGTINGAEACDSHELGGKTCAGLGLGGGVLACDGQCRFDVSACTAPHSDPICGDNIVQGVEACDGQDLNLQTCELLGLPAGTLACTANCDFDTTLCRPPPVVCGDGRAEAAEGCDGTDLRGATCSVLGLSEGTISCTPSCTFDLSRCQASTPTCGNELVENTEECDGADLRDENCETLGLGAGTLGCTDECVLDISGCEPVPTCDYTGVEVCDGVSNDCDDQVDEGEGVCPDDATGRTYGGHLYLLYIQPSDGRGGTQGGQSGGGSWGWTEQQDYGEATTTCRAAGAALGLGVEFDLARIESAEENDFLKAWIREMTTEAGMVWMGANDVGEEGRWVWGQDADAVHFFRASERGGGSPVNSLFNDFTDGRPNSANYVDEDCGAFDSEFDWAWNDLDCSEPRLGLLCEQLD